ncbi:hypothetical protein pmac_cds_803 [Pandoravirus macleodensis]|uniref:Uncharacterized protein n=1 Tax=Pandoravirus macleodensis TaxID=2107707 RepID=A0A2U7UHR3_9VIRU|nr:hypothetical protein pmac_cds_803 [Pandoravirus macleodensis]AVK77491.1 hypothetical protein pmac_cds_803 [Pandoravirus macleodensis]
MQHTAPTTTANMAQTSADMIEEIPRSIAGLFASVAVPGDVDLKSPPRPVDADARMPIVEVARDTKPPDAVGASAKTEMSDTQLVTIMAQAKAVSDASAKLIELMRGTFGEAQVDRVCRDMQWSPPTAAATTAPAPNMVDSGMGKNEINLRKFDVGTLKTGQVNMIVGKRGTGKTVLLRHLLTAGGNRWDFVVGMTPTPESYDVLVEMFPESCVYRDYDSEAIKRLLDTLRTLHAHNIRPRVLLVLDDCMHDNRIFKSGPMCDLYKCARVLDIEFYNVVQYVMDIPKTIRLQIDRVFAMREPQRAYRENLYRRFFDIFSTYDGFSAAFDVCTENCGCIVVDSKAKTNAVEDSVFWHRGPAAPPAILLGSRAQWLLHHMFYRKAEKATAESALDVLMGALRSASLCETGRVRLVDN